MIKNTELDYLNGNKKNKNNKYNFILFYLIRADGRMYKGMWKMGKQDGEGLFFNIDSNIWQKGIWDEGKRVRWIQTE